MAKTILFLLVFITLCESGNLTKIVNRSRQDAFDGKQSVKVNRSRGGGFNAFASSHRFDAGKRFDADRQPSINRFHCQYTEELYKELRMEPTEKLQDKGVKKCEVPGCFFIFPPKDKIGFFPRQLQQPISKETTRALQGCRSDIPYLIQRSLSTKDTKLQKMLRYLRACYVGNVNGLEPTKQCQPEWSSNTNISTNSSNLKESWFEGNVRRTENQCFYPLYNEKVFYVAYGSRSEGRVICCSDGRVDKNQGDEFKKKCKATTEFIYKVYEGGWRNGKDAQDDKDE